MIVKAPASSANLGPGFDCLGLAWQLYNEIEFLRSDTLKISGCPEKYREPDNLAYQGVLAALKAAGRPAEPVEIRFLDSQIPVSRGLGSSAALISAGTVAANELWGLGLSRQELVTAAASVEGHPDNIAPALLGGLIASAMAGERAVSARYALSGRLFFTVLIPDFELSTERARAALPAEYAKADAIFNISRTALLLKGLETGDRGLLALGLEDRIHQPYRERLIPGYDRAKERALRLGAIGMCISGAGSALLCIAEEAAFTEKMAAAMAAQQPTWQVLAVEPDYTGVRICG